MHLANENILFSKVPLSFQGCFERRLKIAGMTSLA